MLKGKIIKIVETPDINWVKYICRGEDNTNFECREKRLLQDGKGMLKCHWPRRYILREIS